jgi:hypothetical protein
MNGYLVRLWFRGGLPAARVAVRRCTVWASYLPTLLLSGHLKNCINEGVIFDCVASPFSRPKLFTSIACALETLILIPGTTSNLRTYLPTFCTLLSRRPNHHVLLMA